MEERFQLVFKGETLEGRPLRQVMETLAALLGLDEAQARSLFSGQAVVIKRSVSRADAARYQGVFRGAGARLRVVPLQSPEPVPGAAGPEAATGPAAAASADRASVPDRAASAPGLAPRQGDLLAPHEQLKPEPVRVTTEHLQLAAREPLPQRPARAATVRVPEHALAPAGSTLPPQPRRQAPRIATEGLQLAPVGSELELLRPPRAQVPDIAHLRLQEG